VSHHVVTVAHEGGHALVGLLTGRRLGGIHLHSDASGFTVTSGRKRGLGIVATTAAGYLTPSLLGLGAAWLLSARYTDAVLLLSLLLLVGMALAVRNLFGIMSVAACVGAVVAVSRWASPAGQSLFAWMIAWLLLLGGPRAVWELSGRRSARPRSASDADRLALLTHVPAFIWVAGFALTTLAALVVGARWLVLGAR
jgi:hypothetical protein